MKLNFNFNLKALGARTPMSRIISGLVVLSVLQSGSEASDQFAAVAGRVLDLHGASVAGAEITLRHPQWSGERTARTDARGAFEVLDIPPGELSLSAWSQGFAVSSERLRVRPGERAAITITLHPGSFAEEVTVVARQIAASPEELRRIPGSIEVLDAGTLETARVANTHEALRKAAGVMVRDEEGFALRPNISIRGTNPTRSSKVLLLEDGLPLAYAPYGDNASYYHPPVERFDRIELVKGSGQVAFGPVTVAGVVNYITPEPPGKPTAAFTLTGGNREYLNARARLGGTWRETGVLIELMRKQGDGARENIHSELDDVNLKLVRPLGGAQSLTLKANYYGENSNITYSGLRLDEYQQDPRQNPFRNDFFYGDRFGASLAHSLLLSSSALLSTQLYGSGFHRDWWRQSSNSAQRPNDAADPACAGMANLDTTCGNEGRLRDYLTLGVQPRLRLTHRTFGVAGEADLGVRVHYEDQERLQENGSHPRARSGVRVENNERRADAFSGFAQNRFLLGALTLTPGIRFEHVRYRRTNRLNGATGDTRVTQWIPGLGASLRTRGDTTLFAGVHRGFAPPRVEDVISNAGGVVELEPERSWTFELGARGKPLEGVRWDVSVFRMDYENQIVPASLAGGLGAALTNAGETLHQGLEVSARVDSGPLLGSRHNTFLRIVHTWLDAARYEGARFSSVPGFAQVRITGNRLPYAPEQSLTAALGYAHPRGIDVGLELVHVGEQFADDLNSSLASADGQRGLIPSYSIWNATLNWRVPRLRSTLFATVKNLSDRTYIVDRARGILPGSPRLVQMGVRAEF
jgi:Fe(3+) dicitrate transport protein